MKKLLQLGEAQVLSEPVPPRFLFSLSLFLSGSQPVQEPALPITIA